MRTGGNPSVKSAEPFFVLEENGLGESMGRGNRAFKSAKRSKELKRLKKKEEKMKKRLEKNSDDSDESEEVTGEETATEITS